MQLPALTQTSLSYCQQAADEEGLFKMLVKNPPDLVDFLAQACDDETWAEDHPQFMNKALTWITNQFFQDRLLMEFAQKVAVVIRSHYLALLPFLPMNLTLKLQDRDLLGNSLLYGSASEYLREKIRRECRDHKTTQLILKSFPYNIFNVVEEFITRNEAADLIHKDKPQVTKILNIAMEWELEELSEICQKYLSIYIERENVLETLVRSHLKRRGILRQACYQFIKELELGYRFEDRGSDSLVFEFVDFTENSLSAFEIVKPYITHLVCSGETSEDFQFPRLVAACPKLVCLDISASKSFSDKLKELPKSLQELELSACLWMDNEKLIALIELFPNLIRLVLKSDVKITYEGWGALKKLERLRSLDISRCTQVGDDDLRIILQACKVLSQLTIEDCRSITDSAFIEIPQYNPDLGILNIARTKISDLPLIEISVKCKQLVTLNLSHCFNISGSAILELIKNAHSLKELNITSCELSEKDYATIPQLRPYLKLFQD